MQPLESDGTTLLRAELVGDFLPCATSLPLFADEIDERLDAAAKGATTAAAPGSMSFGFRIHQHGAYRDGGVHDHRVAGELSRITLGLPLLKWDSYYWQLNRVEMLHPLQLNGVEWINAIQHLSTAGFVWAGRWPEILRVRVGVGRQFFNPDV